MIMAVGTRGGGDGRGQWEWSGASRAMIEVSFDEGSQGGNDSSRGGDDGCGGCCNAWVSGSDGSGHGRDHWW